MALEMKNGGPLISILTPVYNGEPYLSECIESVFAQTYQNWEHIIINNCSTDGSLATAERYAKKDKRIRVYCNDVFVDAETNHNIAFRKISKESKYCKVVSADDKIYPDCIKKMVNLAEEKPTIGIVGSYQEKMNEIQWKGLPKNINILSGREACRLSFLNNIHVFGNPTSVLYRSDLLRKNDPFYPHTLPHADTSAFYKHLINCDFGFVHEVLSMERVHEQQLSSYFIDNSSGNISYIDDFLQYGTLYLTNKEFEQRKNELIEQYYRFLGGCILKLRDWGFWKYQSARFREIGFKIEYIKLIKAVIYEITDEIKKPDIAFKKLVTVFKNKYYG